MHYPVWILTGLQLERVLLTRNFLNPNEGVSFFGFAVLIIVLQNKNEMTCSYLTPRKEAVMAHLALHGSTSALHRLYTALHGSPFYTVLHPCSLFLV